MENLSFNEYQLVYNFFSFTFAAMTAGTLFSWLNLASVSPSYRLITPKQVVLLLDLSKKTIHIN
jgi:hypothetical protein